MAVALKVLRPMATPFLAPTHWFATRLGVLLALCALGALVFGALVLMLGGIDRGTLNALRRRNGPSARREGDLTSGPTERQWADG